MSRIALGQLFFPTTCFAPTPTAAPDCLLRGTAALAADSAELNGFQTFPALLGREVEFVGLVAARAEGGPLTAALHAGLHAALAEALAAAGDLDGVLLSLHGATAAEGEPDVCGRLLQQVRAAIGPQVPLVVTLDISANVTKAMLDAATVLVGGHTWPVTDRRGTGERAARVLADVLKVGADPEVQAVKLPLIATLEERGTADGVLAHVFLHLPTAETLPGMLSAGLFMASPDLDAPDLGWVFTQACYCDIPALDEFAVARACWETKAVGAERLRARAGAYRQVSHPLYPLDDLEERPLAAWAGDMIHPCHCAASRDEDETEGGCGGCGKCCGRPGTAT